MRRVLFWSLSFAANLLIWLFARQDHSQFLNRASTIIFQTLHLHLKLPLLFSSATLDPLKLDLVLELWLALTSWCLPLPITCCTLSGMRPEEYISEVVLLGVQIFIDFATLSYHHRVAPEKGKELGGRTQDNQRGEAATPWRGCQNPRQSLFR